MKKNKKIVEVNGCPFCSTIHDDWSDGDPLQIRLQADILYFYDSGLGWQGLPIRNCPFCGRPLNPAN